ncbi:MAG: sugar ABC transporter substrate-binding protein [Hyphomicrobium sp.]|nr:MAG: sugar ABC transporter substrate-binding protein [Hyphomicrobium sp.]PPD01580.1 MAG: sugar ABC transporter substrate-binding protein [Hyphomicrobium sp.]
MVLSGVGRMRLVLRNGVASAAALLASGCVQLPVGGPNHYVIDREASEAIVENRRAVALEYVLLDINKPVLDNLVEVGPESFFRTFGVGKGTAPELRLGVGDVITISIFESSGEGLFAPTETTTNRPGNYITLPPQTIDFKGNISVPFAGEVRAGGRAISQVQRDIEQRLSKRAVEPQVVIALQEQNATDVAIFGDAASASFKQKIKPGGERILDIVAKAGLKHPGYETFVTLQRGNKRATVFFPRLINSSNENVFVKPGDIIYLYRQQQTFIALGALGNVTQTQELTGRFPFESERLSLTEAVARAGGLLDTRANPSQVFLYRIEYREVLERLGMNLGAFPPDQNLIPTIYRANYRDPSMFFASDQFPMRHKDIIYVANADAVEVEKFLGYARLITSTVAGVSVDALVTRDSIRALGN